MRLLSDSGPHHTLWALSQKAWSYMAQQVGKKEGAPQRGAPPTGRVGSGQGRRSSNSLEQVAQVVGEFRELGNTHGVGGCVEEDHQGAGDQPSSLGNDFAVGGDGHGAPFGLSGRIGRGARTPHPKRHDQSVATFLANALRAALATLVGMTHVVFFASATRVWLRRRYARSTFGDTPSSSASAFGVVVDLDMSFLSVADDVFIRCTHHMRRSCVRQCGNAAIYKSITLRGIVLDWQRLIAETIARFNHSPHRASPLPTREGGIRIRCNLCGAKREDRAIPANFKTTYGGCYAQ